MIEDRYGNLFEMYEQITGEVRDRRELKTQCRRRVRRGNLYRPQRVRRACPNGSAALFLGAKITHRGVRQVALRTRHRGWSARAS